MESGKLVCTRKLYKIMMVYFNNVRPLKKKFHPAAGNRANFLLRSLFLASLFQNCCIWWQQQHSIVARALIFKIYGKILNFTWFCRGFVTLHLIIACLIQHIHLRTFFCEINYSVKQSTNCHFFWNMKIQIQFLHFFFEHYFQFTLRSYM